MTKAITDMDREELLQLVNEMGEGKTSGTASPRLADFEVPEVPVALRVMRPILITVVLAVLSSIGVVTLIAAFGL